MGDMDDSKVRLSNFDLDFATQFKVTVNYDHLVQNMSLIMLGSRLETQESTWKVGRKRAEKTFRSIAIGHVPFLLRSDHVLCIFFGSIFNVSETKNDNYIKLDMISRCAAGPRRHAKLVFPLISTTPRQWLQLNPLLRYLG